MRHSPIEPATRHDDTLLMVIAVGLGLSTLLGVANVVFGLDGSHLEPRGGFSGIDRWNGLAWVLLLTAVLWRSRTHIRRLRGWLSSLAEDAARTSQARAEVTGHVGRIIESAALEIALQPVIDLTSGEMVGAEALSRFTDGTPPADAFALAEEVGRGPELELLALRRALAALPNLAPGTSLSLNASPALILDPRLATELSRPELPLDRLVIEITEHAAVSSYEETARVLDPFRWRGLRLAVDDTGAGYASFNHVFRLRPDIIKLDRCLISEIDRDGARRAFVTAVVLMALELGASVTAEGVERPEEMDVLCSLGVDHAQGFLIARPTTDTAQWARWARSHWRGGVPSVA